MILPAPCREVYNVRYVILYVASWKSSQVWSAQLLVVILYTAVIWVTVWCFMLAGLGETTVERLLWLWTDVAFMLDRGCSTLDITTVGVVGAGYFTVLVLAVLTDGRWKLAALTVTPLDVTTVARCCRQTQYVPHPAQCHQQHYKHHSDSGQQVSSLLTLYWQLQRSDYWRLVYCVADDCVEG
jgi:hypothetical protein